MSSIWRMNRHILISAQEQYARYNKKALTGSHQSGLIILIQLIRLLRDHDSIFAGLGINFRLCIFLRNTIVDIIRHTNGPQKAN